MNKLSTWLRIMALLAMTSLSLAQDDSDRDRDELRIAALEALISAPPEFALPRVRRLLAEDISDEVKESALFILSQIDSTEAQALLLDTAQSSSGDLQAEAIEMIGIGGDPQALAALMDLYDGADSNVRESILEAYLIADDSASIFQIATKASGEDFEAAVQMLGAMGARDELRQLREQGGMSGPLMEAIAISGDYESLVGWAMDGSDPELQAQAIEYLGIVDNANAGETLVEIYRNARNDDIREAALDGMLIAHYDTGVLELYREANTASEKTELLEYLTYMESDAVWEVIDSALEGQP